MIKTILFGFIWRTPIHFSPKHPPAGWSPRQYIFFFVCCLHRVFDSALLHPRRSGLSVCVCVLYALATFDNHHSIKYNVYAVSLGYGCGLSAKMAFRVTLAWPHNRQFNQPSNRWPQKDNVRLSRLTAIIINVLSG